MGGLSCVCADGSRRLSLLAMRLSWLLFCLVDASAIESLVHATDPLPTYRWTQAPASTPPQTRTAHRGGQVRGHLDGCARPHVGAVGSHGGWAHQPVASGETRRVASCMGKRERELL